MPLPLSSGFNGKHGRLFDAIISELRALRPASGPNVITSQNSLGTTRSAVNNNSGAGIFSERWFVRHIGIDAMWCSRPKPLQGMENYWYLVNGYDWSEHVFALKPPQLQNRSWYNEVAAEGLDNTPYYISAGASPQNGLLTVKSVSGENYGSFTGITTRTLRNSDTSPEETYTENISPLLWTVGWGVGDASYSGTADVMLARIPYGLFVCDEKGKIVWDYLTSPTIKPPTLPSVATWAIDDPNYPGGTFSYLKNGYYDVTHIDLNVDEIGRAHV